MLRFALAAFLVALMLAMVILAGPGRPAPVGGTDAIALARLCDDPRPNAPCNGPQVDLPLFPVGAGPHRLRVDVPASTAATAEPLALYFPILADGLDVFVNGEAVLATAPPGGPYWHWNRPAYVSVAQSLLTGRDRLDLVLHAAPLFDAALGPFYVGPGRALLAAYDMRLLLTRDAARVGLLLTLLCTLGMMVLAVIRRRDRMYHWAALAGAAAAVISVHYAAMGPPLPQPLWQVVWTVSVCFLVAALHRFVRRFLRQVPDRAETVTMAFAIVSVGVMAALAIGAPHLLLVGSALIHGTVMAITLVLLVIFARDRYATTLGRFITLFGAMCLTAALGVHDAAFLYLRPPPVAMQLGQFMPLVFMFVTGWLVLMQLVTALARQEALTGKLRQRVVERTRALRRTADKLAQSEREMLLAGERQRIMMDLHDGVGGHLVNALAALRRMPDIDPPLRDALEEAHTDLGLMVDSLYNQGDVAQLLAALRARLEPLLERQGLRFDWQVEQEPQLPNSGPSANIDLLRIAQEFVTNTLKHAGAQCITVETGRRHVRLADDGNGFLSAPLRGHGLTSMRRRAERIGARFELSSGPDGTTLRLEWPVA